MTDTERNAITPEEHRLIAIYHEALATFQIHVNGTLNESRSLPEWIQVLATGINDLREVTAGLREAKAVSIARHKVFDAFLKSRTGRGGAWLWRSLKTPVLTIVGALLVYVVVHYLFPWLLPLVGLGV